MPMKPMFLVLLLAGCVFGVQAQEGVANDGMPSSEKVKEEAKANTKYLASQTLKKAKAVMDAYGEFAPFGAGLFQDGSVNFVWAIKPGESAEGANPVVVLNAVRKVLSTQAENGRILGSAVVYQYQKDTEEGARPQINVEVEYINGYAEVIGTEYEQTNEGLQYTQSGSKQFKPRVFTGSTSLESE